MNCYYLLSSLPVLDSSHVSITYDEFLSACRNCVPAKEMEILESLNLSEKKNCKIRILREFLEFSSALNAEITAKRNKRLGKPGFEFSSGVGVSDVADKAMSMDSPLEAEKYLIEVQFAKIDELSGFDYFNENALLSYAIKLKLLQRLEIFDREDGYSEFVRLCGEVQKKIDRI